MKRKSLNPFGRVLLLCVLLLSGQMTAAIASSQKSTINHSTGSPGPQNGAGSNLQNPAGAPEKGQPGRPDSLHLNLEEIILQANFVTDRQSPLRVATVDQKSIGKKAIGYTYPELIKNMPGIYATSESGSYGDARINIRGFKQENISVLLNGIPISGLVTGNMFWNNWLGLSDATHSIQVQKGIGASMLSDNSVGGTINIITQSTQAKPSTSMGMYITDYGQYKSHVSVNSGQTANGWAFSAMGSYAWGNGYPQSTGVNSWAYMVNISKKINNQHSLLFTALGSPERHKQRSSRLTEAEINQYGLAYNKNWGYHNGKERNLSENFYHKPYLTLHHFYKPSPKRELATAIYLSVGHGGGKWSESKGKRIIDFRAEGLVDWDAAEQANITAGASAQNIVTDYLAGHTQAGFKSNYSRKMANWTFNAGLHYQYYSTWEKEKITDLLGAEYWYEEYATKSLAGLAGRNPYKGIGDMVRTYNGKLINHLSLYTSAQYNSAGWDIRLGASAMGSTNQRWDRYNYIGDVYSKTATGSGMSIKGGVSRKLTRALSVYVNAAVYSRIPYSDIYFSSGNNNITQGVKNENNLLAEAGVRYLFDRGSVELTLYHALWKNKSIMSNPYKQLDESNNRYLVRGLDAVHSGIEITGNYTPVRGLSLEGFAGLGDWKWKNDVTANIYDPYSSLLIQQIHVYSKGLPVGDAPQLQLSLSATANPVRNLELFADWNFYDQMYADFNPSDRQDSNDRSPSYRIPSYSLINGGISWSPQPRGRKTSTVVYARIGNILNTRYIERGRDGASHTIETFSGFWGSPRNLSIGIRLNF